MEYNKELLGAHIEFIKYMKTKPDFDSMSCDPSDKAEIMIEWMNEMFNIKGKIFEVVKRVGVMEEKYSTYESNAKAIVEERFEDVKW